MIGLGSIIGAGYFLGTGLSISIAGPSILLAYLFGGSITIIVFSALAEMSVNDPQPGSFRVYARKAFGTPVGFMVGWLYWISGLLIMASEITALSIFSQFWFPNVPLWVFALIFSLLGMGINMLGAHDFGKIESFFAVIKISTIVSFIIFGSLFILALFRHNRLMPLLPFQ